MVMKAADGISTDKPNKRGLQEFTGKKLRRRKQRVTDTRHGSGSLQPGRPPTNTSFNTPDTHRDRSYTVRVV